MFIKQDSLEDNQKCSKGTFDKSHMKLGPSNMLLIFSYLLEAVH